MSGIAAIYHLDGRPVDPSLLARMTRCIAHRGPDAIHHWVEKSVGLGHCMLATTPEALHETQPLTDQTRRLALTFDGRVDNGKELHATLSGLGFPPQGDTDAELVLRAYECWGEEFPRRILGDFALVLWDGRRRQLFAARDTQGVRPFYYCLHENGFYCGSELRQLLEIPSLRREPNEGMVAEYLANRITHTAETLLRGILRLPAAHYLLLREGRLTTRRYWTINPSRTIRYRTQREYDEHFLAVSQEVIRSCLRSPRRVASELSGGLDSSTIVSLAQQLLRETSAPCPGLATFSLVFPGQPCDESTYIDAMIEHCGFPAYKTCAPLQPASFYAAQVRRYGDFPDYPNGTIGDAVKGLVQEHGCRILLTGFGGDEWLTGSQFYYADLLRNLRLPHLLSWLRHDCDSLGIRGMASRLLGYGVAPLVPAALKRALRGGKPAPPPIPRWLNRDFARRVALSDRLQPAPCPPRFRSRCRVDILAQGSNGWQVHGQELEERGAARFGIEKRHPFYDRRFVEFALALPEEQRQRAHEIKYILRRAMRGLLPETVRTRSTKADFSASFGQALVDLDPADSFHAPTIAALGWVDREQVGIMYQRLAQSFRAGTDEYMDYVWRLWSIFGVDLWYRIVIARSDLWEGGSECLSP